MNLFSCRSRKHRNNNFDPWFGYTLNLLGDVNWELPIDFNVVPACDNENPHCEALLDRLVDSDLGGRCETFVADRGLDNDGIRRKLHDRDILALIDTRNLWQEDHLDADQLKAPTRPLHSDVYDTMLRTECGDLYCRCPEIGRIRLMHYQGHEQQRGTLKWVCPVAAFEFDCQGRAECYRLGRVKAGARSRVVRTKVDVDNLRQRPSLPPSSRKWKRLYRQRSAMERINSRVADGFMMHSHYLCGRKSMGLKITISKTVMLASANFAVECNQCGHWCCRWRPEPAPYGALFLNLLKVAAAALLPRVKFGATQKLNESCRHCELNMLRSKRKPSNSGIIDTFGLDCGSKGHRN